MPMREVAGISLMRTFNPSRVGALECDAWVTYYRRQWLRFLYAALAVIRHGFGLTWLQTVRAAWWVLRANQVWAPYPDNDPAAARRYMARFYRLVGRVNAEHVDPGTAARLEVRWWHVHRTLQRERPGDDNGTLVDALANLYSYVYQVDPMAVRLAASERAEAMRLSDQWVAGGCDADSPLLPRERAALVRSYAALLAAIHGLGGEPSAGPVITTPGAGRRPTR